jgi:hypothetical protein
MKTILLSLTIFILLLTPTFVFAEVKGCNETLGVCSPAGTDALWTPEAVASRYIKIGVGFLGIIALLFFIYAGFLWMTAQGKPDVIKKARDIMIWSVLGIVVILSSYTLLTYIFGNVDTIFNG